jgi:hypothetical protein
MARKAAWLASAKISKSWSGTEMLGFLVMNEVSLSRFFRRRS